jgi:hypothetical protein
MDSQVGMLAQLLERPIGSGPEWRVEDVWPEERDGSQAAAQLVITVGDGRGPGTSRRPRCRVGWRQGPDADGATRTVAVGGLGAGEGTRAPVARETSGGHPRPGAI